MCASVVKASWTAAVLKLLCLVCLGPDFSSVRSVKADVDDDGDISYHTSAPQEAADSPVPDKVGAEVRLTKKERSALRKLDCGMCKAILREMHLEVSKHEMIKKGVGSESQVWETSNAMCLALLQKYRLDLSGKAPQLEPKDMDDEEFLAAGKADAGDYMRAMLVLKMGCQHWLEDYGGDVSGHIFKAVRDGSNTADGVALDYCTRSVALCGKGKKDKRQKEKERERARLKEREASNTKQDKEEAEKAKEDPFGSLPEDSKFGLQRMLEQARDDPLHYLEDDAKERVQEARAALRCDVCRTVLEEVHREVSKRPKSMQREYDILPFAESACQGGKDLSVPNYFGVEAPPLPPVWTDHVRPHFDKKAKRHTLRSFAKKAGKQRRKWRAQLAEGKHQPPPGADSEGDMMLTLACKDSLESARFAEALFTQMAACGIAGSECRPALAAAREVCTAVGGAACPYGDATAKGEASAEKGKLSEEL